ncbi:hypothetical protein KHA95_13895 [Bacillus sp. FJAT-50079]|nr:hypothetical protein [Bacillus sp. FJAT-50079]
MGISNKLPVIIGKGCWIGARSTILPGVVIGDGCVIAASSMLARTANRKLYMLVY